MATFNAEFEVEGTVFPLRRIFFTAARKRNGRGQPASGTDWILFVTIDAQEQVIFADWMFNPTMKKEVTITIYKTEDQSESESVLKKWTYDGLFCLAMVELFIGDASQQTTNLFLSGNSVSNGNATLPHEKEAEDED